MGITYEQLEKANEAIKKTPIKGKDYAEVPQRIKAFRMLYPSGSIQTEIVSLENGVCIIQAKVYSTEGKLLGTGLAYEKEGSTFINKTSYIENCETSAVGRALGMLGIGIDSSVASYEEVANAQAQQKAEETKGSNTWKAAKPSHSTSVDQANAPITKDAAKSLEKALKDSDIAIEWVLACCKVKSLAEVPYGNYMWVLNNIAECKKRSDEWKRKQASSK